MKVINDMLPKFIDRLNPNPLSSVWFELDSHHVGSVSVNDIASFIETEIGISVEESRKKFIKDCFNSKHDEDMIT